MAGRRTKRDEWRKRVERWRDSGLTAKQFAAETGLNAGTLQFWKYKLARQDTPARSPRRRVPAPVMSSLVELRPVSIAPDDRIELELTNGRRLRVSARFDAETLKALAAALEAA